MLKYFMPQDINSTKVRLGNQTDGGYVVPQIAFEKCTALFTYGVEWDISFEEAFIKKYNKPAYLFDHTIDQYDWDYENLHFISEGLGTKEVQQEIPELIIALSEKKNDIIKAFEVFHNKQNVQNARTIKDWLHITLRAASKLVDTWSLRTVREHYDRLRIKGDILLKIDTEGAEFDFFLEADIDDLASFVTGIVLEVHWLEKAENQLKFIEMMEKINKHFILCHTHGNNCSPDFIYKGYKVPSVPEFSFVNRKHITEYTPDYQDYPIVGLDFPNNPEIDECDLSFLKQL